MIQAVKRVCEKQDRDERRQKAMGSGSCCFARMRLVLCFGCWDDCRQGQLYLLAKEHIHNLSEKTNLEQASRPTRDPNDQTWDKETRKGKVEMQGV